MCVCTYLNAQQATKYIKRNVEHMYTIMHISGKFNEMKPFKVMSSKIATQ